MDVCDILTNLGMQLHGAEIRNRLVGDIWVFEVEEKWSSPVTLEYFSCLGVFGISDHIETNPLSTEVWGDLQEAVDRVEDIVEHRETLRRGWVSQSAIDYCSPRSRRGELALDYHRICQLSR